MDNTTRSGSLQFYPRCRAKKIIPSVNWRPVAGHNRKENTHNGTKAGLMGFVGYKVAMTSVAVKDETPDSMTKGKKIIVPGTIIECPSMKIYSIRFYKNSQVVGEIVVSNDKILRRKIKVAKNIDAIKSFDEHMKKIVSDDNAYDDVRVVLFSEVFKTGIGKKKPNLLEIGLSGNRNDKLHFAKEKIGKEISVADVFGASVGKLVDIHGVTKGYGLQGPVKRFGIGLKSHKAEKGQRRPGSLGPWKPARTTYRAPQAGQVGYFTRISYNSLIMKVGSVKDNKDAKGSLVNIPGGYKRYGNIKTDYMILRGSVPGPKMRGLAITSAIRPTKFQAKKKLEVLELR